MHSIPFGEFGLRRFLIVLVAAVIAGGCTKVQSGPSSPAATPGGRHPWTIPHVLRVDVPAEPNSLNPILTANTVEAALARLTFDGLVSVDATGRHDVPILAAAVPTLQNGGVSRDGLTITYHLRHGVRWQDGAPFTSADVKFTVAAILNNRNNVISRTGFTLVKSVGTPDPYTAVFHMKHAYAPAVDDLFGESDSPYEILPAHLLSKYPDINHVPFNGQPIGTGPFILKRWQRGDHLEYVANPHYFRGKPKLDRIVVHFVTDENTALNQLRAHELDWQFEPQPQEYKDLKPLTDVRSILVQGNQYERIQMNTRHPPLDDVRVRRAIAYAINLQRLVDDLTFGSAAVADQDLPPFMWAHATNVTVYPYDPRKAGELLDSAGWKLGPDGFRHKSGRRLSLDLAYDVENATRRRGVVLVQAMLRKAGIAIEPKPYLAQLFFAQYQLGGILQTGKFDLGWSGWVAGIDPDNSTNVTCAAIPPNGQNNMFYCNHALDALENSALSTFDRTARKADYERIEQILSRDEPQVDLWWPRQIQAINPDLTGFTPNPVTETWNAYQWDI